MDGGSFLELMGDLGESEGLTDGAQRTIAQAVALTGARWAELVTNAHHNLTVLASVDKDLTRELMRAVQDSGQGPPPPSRRPSVNQIVIDDLPADRQWPAFSALAGRRTAVRSAVLQFVTVGDRYAAVMPVYHDKPHFFTPERSRAVSLLGSVAGLALAGLAAAEEAEQLRSAVATNRVISAAVGILMSTEQIDAEAAYGRLRRRSQQTNRKVRDVAAEVLDLGSTKHW